jgi:LysM domain
VSELSAGGTAGPPDPEAPRAGSKRTVTPAVAGALIILALSFALSVAFVLANGGLDLPAAASSPSASNGPTPSQVEAPRPTAGRTAGPLSDRYELLTACPGTPDCWIYVVRRGDNLSSIASYFGVSLKAVESHNPWTRTAGLVAGQKLRLPAPTN